MLQVGRSETLHILWQSEAQSLAVSPQQGAGLSGLQVIELHLQIETAQRRLIQYSHQIGRCHEHALEGFHLSQHLVDEGSFPTAAGTLSVTEKTVHFVYQEQRAIA